MGGDIHLWTPGNLPPISMAHNGAPVIVDAGTNCVNWTLEKLTVRRDANITKPEDLYRIKIGLLQGSTSSAFLYYLAKHYGLDEKRLHVVNLPPPEQLASLLSNAVQGLICWEPWPARALQSGETVVVHTGTTSNFAANAGQSVKVSDNRSIWVVSQEFERKNPKTVQAMMRVLVRAQRYVADPKNTDEAIKLFSDFQKQDAELNRKIWNNYVFMPVFDDAYVSDMEHTADFLEATGYQEAYQRARLHLQRATGCDRPGVGQGGRTVEGVIFALSCPRNRKRYEWARLAPVSSRTITWPVSSPPAAPTYAWSDGRTQESTRTLATRYGIPDIATDWRGVLDRKDLDAVVIITTPDHTHAEIAIAAAAAGRRSCCKNRWRRHRPSAAR